MAVTIYTKCQQGESFTTNNNVLCRLIRRWLICPAPILLPKCGQAFWKERKYLNAVSNALMNFIGQRDQQLVFYLLAHCEGCNTRECRIFWVSCEWKKWGFKYNKKDIFNMNQLLNKPIAYWVLRIKHCNWYVFSLPLKERDL